MTEQGAPKPDETRAVGRGVLAIAFAKLYFIFTGLVVQFGLPRILKWVLLRQGFSPAEAPLAAQEQYGDYKLVNNTVSQLNNTVITGTIQTVSRFTAAREEALGSLKRRALALQLFTGGGLALSYALMAGFLAKLQLSAEGEGASKAQGLAGLMRLSAVIVLAYSFYAIFIGVLNGRRRFLAQASFDIGYSTLRTTAIVAAAGAGLGVFGIFGAFATAAVLICFAAALVVGPLSGGRGAEPKIGDLARAGAGIFGYTLLFNLLLFADSQAVRPLVAYGLGEDFPNISQTQSLLSGVYGAVQNIGLVPYQLVIAVTFVVFPLVSRSTFEQDLEATRAYIKNALRYSLLLLSLLVAGVIAAPRGLVILPHGAEYVEGGEPLRVFAVGQIFFALLAVSNTILIGAGKTGKAAEAVGLGLVGVFGTAAVLVPGAALQDGGQIGPVLTATAISSAVGMSLGLVRSLFAVRSLFGVGLPMRTVTRVFILLASVGALGLFLPESIAPGAGVRLTLLDALLTLARGVGGLSLVALGLFASGEIGPEDRARFARVFRRGR